jgi:hypothetical protein
MPKVYQPIVIEEAENLLEGLKDSKFFEEYEITDLTFAKEYLLEIMTEKYISGLIGDFDGENGELFSEEEFSKLLKEIVAGSILNSLKEEGYLNSYEDETTEELFFLTEKGKKHLEDLNNGIIN